MNRHARPWGKSSFSRKKMTNAQKMPGEEKGMLVIDSAPLYICIHINASGMGLKMDDVEILFCCM